jgi:hypothetical protein
MCGRARNAQPIRAILLAGGFILLSRFLTTRQPATIPADPFMLGPPEHQE